VLLVQDLLHGQQLDDPPRGALVERRALLFGVVGVAEGDEEAALAAVGAPALRLRAVLVPKDLAFGKNDGPTQPG